MTEIERVENDHYYGGQYHEEDGKKCDACIAIRALREAEGRIKELELENKETRGRSINPKEIDQVPNCLVRIAALELALKIGLDAKNSLHKLASFMGSNQHKADIQIMEQALSGSKLSELFSALLEEHKLNDIREDTEEDKAWEKVEVLRKDCNL